MANAVTKFSANTNLEITSSVHAVVQNCANQHVGQNFIEMRPT